VKTVFLVSASFFLGAVPTAYLFVKALKKTDIRGQGSGNVGATNAARILGKPLGVLIFTLDFLKGYLPVFFATRFFLLGTPEGLWIGLAAILGHIFSPFLGFRGGKGVATGAGVLMASYPTLFFLGAGVWGAVFFLTRVVSISSLLSISSITIITFFMRLPIQLCIFFVLMTLLIFWAHRSNLQRLIRGEEKKIS
jgi:glycerol-3-phosphate acyltransferase PlsY